MSAPPTAGANPTIYVPPTFNIPQTGIPNVPTPVIPPPAPKQPQCTTPNTTIYINNLNEKVKLPGIKYLINIQKVESLLTYLLISSEESLINHFRTVW